MKRILIAAWGGLFPLVALYATAEGQEAEILATLSSDTAGIGEVFELRLSVPVSPESMVYFPDTVPASPRLESFAPVEWRAESEGNSGAILTLTYPLIPFTAGTVSVPGVDVFTAPAGGDAEGEPLPGGSFVGEWDDSTPLPTSTTRSSTPQLQISVEPPYTAEEVVEGVSPRPPGDVAGPSWSLASVALILLFSSVIGTAGVATTRDWLTRRADSRGTARFQPLTMEEARRAAVAELDRLLVDRPQTEAQVRLHYKASSGIIRRYVERFEAGWGPALTSTELMGRLAASNPVGRAPLKEMSTAETVKFGPLRPGVATVDEHLRTLRSWLTEADENDS